MEHDCDHYEGHDDRRKTPHPYEMFAHMDARLSQVRDDLMHIMGRQEDHERKLRRIEDAIQQAAGMARLLRWVIISSGAAWATLIWARQHFHW